MRFVYGSCLEALRSGVGGVGAVLGIEAVCVAVEARIYLSRRWRGDSHAARSVLVHELVHHAQATEGGPVACPEAAEKEAYALQEEWLARYGLTLEELFGLDRLTRFVLTECGM